MCTVGDVCRVLAHDLYAKKPKRILMQMRFPFFITPPESYYIIMTCIETYKIYMQCIYQNKCLFIFFDSLIFHIKTN